MSKILMHPAQPKRAWHVISVGPGQWIGALIGGRDPFDDGPMSIDAGPIDLVIEALKHRHVRQGLPIVVLKAGEQFAEVAA